MHPYVMCLVPRHTCVYVPTTTGGGSSLLLRMPLKSNGLELPAKKERKDFFYVFKYGNAGISAECQTWRLGPLLTQQVDTGSSSSG
jgi:hypothetical protein